MGMELLGRPWAGSLVVRAEEILGYSPAVALGDPEKLAHTAYVQPLLLFVEWLITETLTREAGLIPQAVCGHSLGEYTALAAAGVISWEDALWLAARRGRLMEEVARKHPGTMAAIIAPQAEVERIAAETGCFAVNYNAPEQVVVSGENASVERAVARARERGFRAVPLRVMGPFHTPLMWEAEAEFRQALEEIAFSSPRVKFVSAVSGRPETDPGEIRRLMGIQMTSPVRWTEVIRALEGLGVTEAVEVGPGEVLTKLGRRTSRGINFKRWGEYVGL
jgi:[acyl-carrier-protein] S-malonyltransferase